MGDLLRPGTGPQKGDRRRLHAFIRLIAETAVWGALLAVTGPFDTYGLGNFWARFLYWAPLILVSLSLVRWIKPRITRRYPGRRIFQEFATTGLFLAIFMPFLIIWTDYGFPEQATNRPDWGTLFLFVIGVCVSIILGMHLVPQLFLRETSEALATEPTVAPRLARRLPEDFQGRVLRLSGDGHYVKVSTSEGQFEVRLRLRDAVDEMHGVPGFWSHRSHWVATEAISDWNVRKGRPVLELSNGDVVPVGAKYQPELEAAGFVFDRGITTEKA